MRTKLLILILCAAFAGFLVSARKTTESTPATIHAVRHAVGGELSGAVSAPRAGVSAEDGQLLVQQAATAMQQNYSVSAQIAQKAVLLGQEVIGLGMYCEQRSNQGLRFRLEIKIQAQDDDRVSGLLQVCDGRYLWNYRKLRGAESLSCVDLVTVQQRLEETGTVTVRPLDQWPGMGGLPKLLRSFDKAFLFDKPERANLQGDFPTWKVEGGWRPEMLARAVPDHKEAIEKGRGVALEDLPAHLPNRVVLFLGTEDLFPYSVRYYRLDGNSAHVRATPSDVPMVQVNMTRVRFNQSIPAAQFVYEPSLPCADETEQMLKKLGVK